MIEQLTNGIAQAERNVCYGIYAAINRDMTEVYQVAHERHHG